MVRCPLDGRAFEDNAPTKSSPTTRVENPFSGRTMKKLIVLILAVLIAGMTVIGFGYYRRIMGYSTPKTKELLRVETSFSTLSYYVRSAYKEQPDIRTFAGMCAAVAKKFPDVTVEPTGSNPFPGILPQRTYDWAQEYPTNVPTANMPFLWTQIELDGGDSILAMSWDGEFLGWTARDWPRYLAIFRNRGIIVLEHGSPKSK
jgi:hypothetical protein